jgi:3-methylfumaryl-CoA hydratase
LANSFSDWIGKTEIEDEVAEAWPLRGYLALIGEKEGRDRGDPLPPLAHWLYFGPRVPQPEIGEDGHPRRGGFLPPISLPRRMWAASEIRFLNDIRLGDTIRKTSKIVDIMEKDGKSGKLAFVKIENVYSVRGSDALSELQTLVYRDEPAAGDAPAPGKAAPTGALWSARVDPTTALLFRYSAVTFNAHRIH